jgi:hypothetical protein
VTPKLWFLAAIFYPLWLLAGAVVTWSIYALKTEQTTTSQIVSEAGPLWAAFAGLVAGFVVNLVAAHWWVGVGHLRYAMLGMIAGLLVGGAAGGLWWPVTR